MSLIPPGERRELRSVVRSQFKVLRTEVKQRESELVAEAERQLMERYRDEDKRQDDLNWRIREVVDQANKDLTDLLREFSDDAEGGRWSRIFALSAPRITRRNEDRPQLHAALTSGIKSQVSSALLALDRQEADLLRQLAMESLQSDEAQVFLGRIPTVAELVPSSRLREIETAFDLRKAAGEVTP
jgi:lipopolysaccharide biosynthesis regulator YciM